MPFNRPIPDHKLEPQKPAGARSLVQAEKLMQIAVLLPAAAVIGWLAGAWLDTKFHQTWIGLVGILFGGISGLVYVVRMVTANGTSESAKNQDGAHPNRTRPMSKP